MDPVDPVQRQLDAYNAAFRIPEIALDILVGAGLSAPFVPIFSRLLAGPHEQGAGQQAVEAVVDHAEIGPPAQVFGQTVLTAAVAAIAVALVVLFFAAPWLADTVWSSSSQDFLNLSTPSLACSMALMRCWLQTNWSQPAMAIASARTPLRYRGIVMRSFSRGCAA